MSSRRPDDLIRRALDRRRPTEADMRYRTYVRPAGAGLHAVQDLHSGQQIVVASAAGHRTFRPGARVPTGSHTGFPGEVILGLPPAEERGASRFGFAPGQSREFGPPAPVTASYVAILIADGSDLVARTYDVEGAALADLDLGAAIGGALGQAAFLRGATPGSLDGCAVAFLALSGGIPNDLRIIDLEALQVVSPATTDRHALLSGGEWHVSVRAGTDGWWWEFGAANGTGASLNDPLSLDYCYLRRVSRDGSNTSSVVAEIASPLNWPYAPDPERPGFLSGVFQVSADEWGAAWKLGEVEEVRAVTIVDESGTPSHHMSAVTAAGDDLYSQIGMVLGSGSGGTTMRTVETGASSVGGFNYDETYDEEALFSITGFTVGHSSVSRDGTVLAVRVSDGASRICTWDGSHPIGDADVTDGPTFEGDWGASETLLWVFGL